MKPLYRYMNNSMQVRYDIYLNVINHPNFNSNCLDIVRYIITDVYNKTSIPLNINHNFKNFSK